MLHCALDKNEYNWYELGCPRDRGLDDKATYKSNGEVDGRGEQMNGGFVRKELLWTCLVQVWKWRRRPSEHQDTSTIHGASEEP